MGLFGKKVKFEDDGVVAGLMPPAMESQPVLLSAPIQVSQPTVAPAAAPVNRPAYGIDDAIKLMRTLPVDRNADLVVRVVRQTLESLNVRVDDIISDAERREATIHGQIKKYTDDIAELEGFIKTHREEIARLEQEAGEITIVRQRLRFTDGTAGGKISLVAK